MLVEERLLSPQTISIQETWKTQTSDLAHQDDDITTISQRVLDIKSFIIGHGAHAQPSQRPGI